MCTMYLLVTASPSHPQRVEEVILSHIYTYFFETLADLSTIRALRASRRFMAENEKKQNINQ